MLGINNLGDFSLIQLDETHLNQKVCEFVGVDEGWDWGKLGLFLLEEFREILAAVKTPSPNAFLQ